MSQVYGQLIACLMMFVRLFGIISLLVISPQSVFNQNYLRLSHSLDRTVVCAKANVSNEIAEWAFNVGKSHDPITAMAIADDKLYLTHKPANLVVLDLASGEARQRFNLGAEPCFQGLSIANESIFVTTVSGVIKFSATLSK